MIKTDKLIICVSPTSNFHGKEANPALPIQPDEIVNDVIRCWNEGASIVHIHVRDKDGIQSNDPAIFAEIDRKIRERGCDIIIQHSTALALRPGSSIDDGMRSLEPGPEMASLNMGLGSVVWQGHTYVTAWTREFIQHWAGVMKEKGIKAELEIYNPAQMYDVYTLIEKGLIWKPYWMSFVVGMHRVNQGAMPYSPKILVNYVDMLPEDAMFSTIGIGADELPASTLSILLGGHLRVGFEDNIYYKKGVLAESNAQLVARAARLGRELGREPASPAEARELLGIPPLKKSG